MNVTCWFAWGDFIPLERVGNAWKLDLRQCWQANILDACRDVAYGKSFPCKYVGKFPRYKSAHRFKIFGCHAFRRVVDDGTRRRSDCGGGDGDATRGISIRTRTTRTRATVGRPIRRS
jgi:hypothetical protein